MYLEKRIKNPYYLWHPDFIQVGDEITVLDTGKWVVEWDEISSSGITHKRAEFESLESCKEFYKNIYKEYRIAKYGIESDEEPVL